ncbi:hemolysin III family protein [soil metagenome]
MLPLAAAEELVPRLRGVSHAVAFFFALAAAAVIVVLAPRGEATTAVTVYGAALVALFGASALYHRWPGPRRFKPLLRKLDHSAIFVFIAASYTPVAAILVHGTVGWLVLVGVWAGAALGVAFSLGWIDAPRPAVAGSYVVLGWFVVIAVPQLVRKLDPTPLALFAAGAILYTVGALVYARRRPDPWPRTFGFHEVFHALVIAAVAMHYVAMIGWVLPAARA